MSDKKRDNERIRRNLEEARKVLEEMENEFVVNDNDESEVQKRTDAKVKKTVWRR